MVSSRKREKRRVVSACTRCRHHKIKCTGECPCSNCIQRNVECVFQEEEEKVRIAKSRLSELNQRNSELEKQNIALQKRLSGHNETAATPGQSPPSPRLTSPINEGTTHSAQSSINRFMEFGDNGDAYDTNMVNPLSRGPPKYITDVNGKPHYLGDTSTWSLTIQLLHLTHQALYKCPFPSADHHIDSMTYDLQWNGLRTQAIPDVRGLPSLDHALFLINATKFHTDQIFHLFDEPTFMAQLYQFYENPAENINTMGLWLIHFLVIIALGKAFVGVKSRGNIPPGAEFFRNAFMMLPDYSFLWKDPCTSAEILCAFALYLQSIDWRTSAHNMIGQALRILEVHGYHMNLSSRVTDQHYLIRCQNVWWTVYVLERQISVLMGAPLSINDNDISASLPSFPDSPLKTAAAAIHVKLSQAFGQVVNALYRESGHRRSTLVKSAQGVLQKVANVAPDLREYFPVPEQESMNGISRVTGYMNLLYHQCVMLATRPFLFILVEMCANSEEPLRDVPTPVKLLLQICLESAKETIFILSALQDQTLLECFLPFHLESAVSAGLVFTMASLASPSLIESHTYYLGPLSSVLDQIIEQGNLIAAGQKKELNQLESLCASLKVSPAMGDYAVSSQLQEGAIPATGLTSGPLEPIGNDHGQNPNQAWTGQFGEPSQSAINMSPTQLLEVVDMMNGDSLLDWLDLPATALEFGNEGH